MQAVHFNSLDAMLERWSDRLNPVLVKEVRQVLKSRGFAGTFFVMLALTFVASLWMVAAAGDRLQLGEPGAEFFGVYLGVLMLALCFVVPLSVLRSVAAEFQQHTFESLAVTTLSAQRIVMGKLQGAFVQMAAYYSAVAPFVCFTYLLGGVSLPAIVMALVITWVSSLAICLGGLMLGSLIRGSVGEIIALLVLMAGASIAYLTGTGMATSVASTSFGWDDMPSALAGFACLAYAGLFYGLLTLGVAFNQFTPTMGDASSSLDVEYMSLSRQQRTDRLIASQTPNAASATTTKRDENSPLPRSSDLFQSAPSGERGRG